MNEEMRAAYPGCAGILEYIEKFATFFDKARALKKSPVEAAMCLKLSAELVLVADPGLPELLQQMDHPDFLKYVAAKLGAM
jgi:hypothetical protein